MIDEPMTKEISTLKLEENTSTLKVFPSTNTMEIFPGTSTLFLNAHRDSEVRSNTRLWTFLEC